MAVFVGFHALDVGEVQALVVQRDVCTVFGILLRCLPQPLAKDLGSYPVWDLALHVFSLGFVHKLKLSSGAHVPRHGHPGVLGELVAPDGSRGA